MSNIDLTIVKVDPTATSRGLILGISDERGDELAKIAEGIYEKSQDVIEATCQASKEVETVTELVYISQYLQVIHTKTYDRLMEMSKKLESLLGKSSSEPFSDNNL